MKIKDIKLAYIGQNITIRIVTDKDGMDGYGQVEYGKEFIIGTLQYYKDMLIGCDPTDVEFCMRRIRRAGAFKPWGKIVSTIEMALWDVAGKNAGLPVYKLLGGKVRDRVRMYNGGFQNPNPPHPVADTPEKLGENLLAINAMPEGVSIFKLGTAWHSSLFPDMKLDYYAYNTYETTPPDPFAYNKGSLLTEKALNGAIEYIARLKSVTKDKVGIALDCGPGFTPVDALKFAKAMEPFHILWLEDMIAGDFTPWTMAHVYRDITMQTTTPIHTGEQLYLRQNCRELIETQAINVIGPDPADVGGIAELKWIAEYADLHGILMAPHGGGNGVFGMAALTHVCATMPNNYIAYEYPPCFPAWWADILEGLPDQYLKDGHVAVWDKPGLGLTFNVNKATKYLRPEDKDFFM